MKRLITSGLSFALLLSVAGFVGCGEEAKVESETKISTPDGTSTIKETKEVENTGSNPPIEIKPEAK